MSGFGKGRLAIALASAVVATLATAALPARTMAADLDQMFVATPPDSAPVQPVEFGTGWYIRGDVDAAFQTQASLSPSFNNEPSAHSTNWALEIGGGYKFNNWIRMDATYTYYGKQTSNSNGALVNCPASLNPVYSDPTDTVLKGVAPDPSQCTPKQSASLQKNLFLLNGYVDLGTWAGVTPYIGAGVGAAYITGNQSANFYNVSDGSPYAATLSLPSNLPLPIAYYNPATGQLMNPQPHYNTGPQNWNYSYSTSKWNFAFALMAGVSYDLTSNAKLDIGYRYVNFGSFSGITSLSGALFNNQTTTQEVRVGIRYQID